MFKYLEYNVYIMTQKTTNPKTKTQNTKTQTKVEIKLDLYEQDVETKVDSIKAALNLIYAVYDPEDLGFMDISGEIIPKRLFKNPDAVDLDKLMDEPVVEGGGKFGVISVCLRSEKAMRKYDVEDPHIATITLREVPESRDSFVTSGYEMLEKTVARWGNGGGVHVPAQWIGEPVKIIRVFPKENPKMN